MHESDIDEIVNNFFAYLGDKSFIEWERLWAEDAVVEYPFAPSGFPQQVKGRACIVAHYRIGIERRKHVHYDIERIISHHDRSACMVEFSGSSVLEDNRKYENKYVGVFSFQASRISCFREYFDPLSLLSLHGTGAAAASHYSGAV